MGSFCFEQVKSGPAAVVIDKHHIVVISAYAHDLCWSPCVGMDDFADSRRLRAYADLVNRFPLSSPFQARFTFVYLGVKIDSYTRKVSISRSYTNSLCRDMAEPSVGFHE